MLHSGSRAGGLDTLRIAASVWSHRFSLRPWVYDVYLNEIQRTRLRVEAL